TKGTTAAPISSAHQRHDAGATSQLNPDASLSRTEGISRAMAAITETVTSWVADRKRIAAAETGQTTKASKTTAVACRLCGEDCWVNGVISPPLRAGAA